MLQENSQATFGRYCTQRRDFHALRNVLAVVQDSTRAFVRQALPKPAAGPSASAALARSAAP